LKLPLEKEIAPLAATNPRKPVKKQGDHDGEGGSKKGGSKKGGSKKVGTSSD
jgi:hypothetical protein